MCWRDVLMEHHKRRNIPALDERFFDKVEFPSLWGACWLWKGALQGTRKYGHMVSGLRRVGAHRVAYELAIGPIPEGLHIDHLCKITLCVNPQHLEPVTHQENMRRARGRKNRARRPKV